MQRDLNQGSGHRLEDNVYKCSDNLNFAISGTRRDLSGSIYKDTHLEIEMCLQHARSYTRVFRAY